MNRTIERARTAEVEGELWRAKEMLQGRVASHKFDPDVCAYLGEILLKMGDKYEAGKFLFVSGRRKSEYEDAIKLYLKRFEKASAAQLHSSFPARARQVRVVELPTPVGEALLKLGYSEKELKALRIVGQPSTLKQRIGDIFALGVVLGILGLFVLGVVNGIKTIFE